MEVLSQALRIARMVLLGVKVSPNDVQPGHSKVSPSGHS